MFITVKILNISKQYYNYNWNCIIHNNKSALLNMYIVLGWWAKTKFASIRCWWCMLCRSDISLGGLADTHTAQLDWACTDIHVGRYPRNDRQRKSLLDEARARESLNTIDWDYKKVITRKRNHQLILLLK